MAYLVERLPNLQEGLSKDGGEQHMVVGAWLLPSTQEVEAGGSEVQGHPWPCSKLGASLSYMRPCVAKERDLLSVLGNIVILPWQGCSPW